MTENVETLETALAILVSDNTDLLRIQTVGGRGSLRAVQSFVGETSAKQSKKRSHRTINLRLLG